MMPSLANYLNKTVLVSIPALSDDDDQPRPFTLVAIEPCGLWLDIEELADKWLPSDKERPSSSTRAAFVPFAQILFILDGAHILTPVQKQAALAVSETVVTLCRK
jgi:hypothetical protein